MQTYANMSMTYVEKPNLKLHGGYNYLVSCGAYGYVAFKTKKGFDSWLERCNLTLHLLEEKATSQYGVMKHYRVAGEVTEQYIWNLSELPAGAAKFKGLCNGSLVDCYYLQRANGVLVFLPNPNAKDIYKPYSLKERIEYMRVYG